MVTHDGPSGSWNQVKVKQEFTVSEFFGKTLTGKWKREEYRHTVQGNASEEINTMGSFSLSRAGTCSKPAEWSCTTHYMYDDLTFRAAVKCLLLAQSRPGTILHLLPKDVLFLIVQELAAQSGNVPHERFSDLMLHETGCQSIEDAFAHVYWDVETGFI